MIDADGTERATGDRERAASPDWQPASRTDAAGLLRPVRATPASLARRRTTACVTVTLSAARPIPTATRSTLADHGRHAGRAGRRRRTRPRSRTPGRDRRACGPSAQPAGDGRVYRIAFDGVRRPRRRPAPARRPSRSRATGQRRGGRLGAAELRLVRLASPCSTSILAMFIDVRLFAMLRERAGSDSVTVEVPEGATVRDAVERSRTQHGLGDLIDAHVGRDGREPRVRGRRRAPRRGRRAGADPAGQRRRDGGRGGSRPARATSSSWSWSATTLPRGRTTSSCSACARCTRSPATSACEFRATEQFLNPAGIVQGGFLTAMLDDTMGPAAIAQLGPGYFTPTLELKVSFLRPAAPGRLVCDGRVVHMGKSVAFLEGSLADERGKRRRDRHGDRARREARRSEVTTSVAHARVTAEPLSLEALARMVGRPRSGRDRDVPGHDPRRRLARVRGLPRDGRGADRGDRDRRDRAPRARGRRRRAPGGDRAAGRGERRGRGRPPRIAARRSRARARSLTASRQRRRSGRRRSRRARSAGSKGLAREAMQDDLRALPSVERLLQTEPLRSAAQNGPRGARGRRRTGGSSSGAARRSAPATAARREPEEIAGRAVDAHARGRRGRRSVR